jgi:hypothetical protein
MFNVLAYWPFNPVSNKLSNCKMKVPGFVKSGKYRVTSLRYVQMIPAPIVGSGVDVLQTFAGALLGSSRTIPDLETHSPHSGT